MERKDSGLIWKFVILLFLPVLCMALLTWILMGCAGKGTMSVSTVRAIMAVAVLLVLGLYGVVIQLFTKKLRDVSDNIGKIADGTMNIDFGTMEKRSDELGGMMRNVKKTMTGFAQMVVGINKAIVELKQVTTDFQSLFGTMEESLGMVHSEVGTITDNTVSQAARMRHVEQKILDISQAIELITDNITALAKSADAMKDCNATAENIMTELVKISQEGSRAIEEVKKQTERTNSSAQEIQQATEIIAGISSQTNLLALNASIEAARAGENGKGFAVVAEEIRALADQSRESTEQISNVVNALIENSNVSVKITQQVTEAYQKQNEKIGDTEEIFGSLNQEIQVVNQSIDEISTEVMKLNSHKDEMNQEIESVSDAASENSVSAENTKQSMENFKQNVTDCNQVKERVIAVSNDLLKYSDQFGNRRDNMIQKVIQHER